MMQDWSEVQPGDVVEGKDGRPWSVLHRSGSVVTLVRDGRDPFTGSPSGQVKVISSAAAEREMSEALVAVRLGGEAIARTDAQGRWRTPVEFGDPGSLLAHLYLLHGIGSETESLADLLKEHAALHTAEGHDGYEPHVHTPDFNRVLVAG